MNILMLSTGFFEPPMDGGALRIWHILRQAAKRHNITFLGMHLPGCAPSRETLDQVGAFAERIVVVERPHSIARRAACAVRSICTAQPYALANYRFAGFENALRQLLAERRYDIVHAHHPHTAQYQSLFSGYPMVYDAQNVYAELWKGYAESKRSNPLLHGFALRQAALLERAETNLLRTFDTSAACSEHDRAHFLSLAPEASVQVLPNGVDSAHFSPVPVHEERHAMLFTGALNVPANVDACVHLVRGIMPLVSKTHPDAKVYLVGKNPVRTINALASDRVVVIGNVPDMRPYHARAQVFVAPLRIGSGTRLKILEAMSMERAVVSTPRGAMGLDCVDAHHLLLRDDVQGFAEAVRSLFDDADARMRLGKAGRELVLARYDWNLIADKLEALYTLASARAKTRLSVSR